ncbi:uncharacterized protein LOC125672624 isoform X2 [Ostrea edulis]|uniref:uncharacterized protein LOC125672624 isoform X2 n=1 Tax=Ostrea edulis TaxID=37623 RepID=UPI0024AF80AF|nr:uncharacterized protein LOC125672624 isoform X2 [Ostrea edulis]
MFRWLIFLCLCLFTNGHSRKVYLDEYCGKTLHIQGPWMRMKLTRRENYLNNFNCKATIISPEMTPSGNPSRLMVVVDKLETKCPGDRLSLANGNTSIPLQGLASYLCGEHKPKHAIYTVSSILVVSFQSDASKNDDGFELYITRFHSGICEENEFRCNRGPCIAKSLHCDDHDQCGDDSDECACESGIVGVLIGAICLGSFLTIITICCCCFKNRSCNRSRTQGRIIPPFKGGKIHSTSSNHEDKTKVTSPEMILTMHTPAQVPPPYLLSPPAYTAVSDFTVVDQSGGPLPVKTPIS